MEGIRRQGGFLESFARNNTEGYASIPLWDPPGNQQPEVSGHLLQTSSHQAVEEKPVLRKSPTERTLAQHYEADNRRTARKPVPAETLGRERLERDHVCSATSSTEFDGDLEQGVETNELLETSNENEMWRCEFANNPSSSWQPFWLRKRALSMLAILFAVTGASLFILWSEVKKLHGLSLTVTSNHYLWTYGPTALLTLLLCFWRQVDYYTKLLQPWKNMQRGPVVPSRSLLLDYVSQFQLTAVIDAIRYKDVPVIISIVGFVTLKLLVVFSTALLVLTSTPAVKNDAPGTLSFRFNASSWNAPDSANYMELSSDLDDGTSIDTVSMSYPAYDYYAMLNDNLEEPRGYRDGIAYQPLELPKSSSSATKMTVVVQAFVPTTKCETTSFTILPYNASGLGGFYNATAPPIMLEAESPSCDLGPGASSSFALPQLSPSYDILPQRQLTAGMRWVNCSVQSYNKTYGSDSLPSNVSDGDFRWALSIADISYNQTFSPYRNSAWYENITTWSRNVNDAQLLFCTVKYQMSNLLTTYAYGGGSASSQIILGPPLELPANEQLPGLTNVQLADALLVALSSTLDISFTSNFTSTLDQPDGSTTLAASNSLFQLMHLKAGGARFESFFNGTAMSEAAEDVCNKISALCALQHFVIQERSNTTGVLAYNENRLQIRMLSLFSMMACSLLVVGLCILLAFQRPLFVVPRPPDNIEALAAIAAASKETCGLLSGTGHSHENEIGGSLWQHLFSTTRAGSFRIESEICEENPKPQRKLEKTEKPKGKWIPLAVQYPMIWLTFGLPLAAIVVLELLQRVSDKQEGLVTLKKDIFTDFFFYGTSLLMLTIATLFNNLDHTIALFTPFSTLKVASSTSRRSVHCNLIRRTPLISLWEALHHRHFGAALSNLAGLVGSFLTIVSSGLWLVELTEISRDINVRRVDTWNTSWPDSWTNDNKAGLTLSIIQHQNSSYPSWTWEELAFPKVSQPAVSARLSNIAVDSSAVQTYSFTLPALRANLNCTQVPYSELNISSTSTIVDYPSKEDTSVDASLEAAFQVPLSQNCLAGADKNISAIDIILKYAGIVNVSATMNEGNEGLKSYLGDLRDLSIRGARRCMSDEPADPACATEIDPDGCPSLIFTFGFFQFNSTPAENLTIFICSQELQEIQTSVSWNHTFAGGVPKEGDINFQVVPGSEESNVKLLTNGTTGTTSFPFRISRNLYMQLQRPASSLLTSVGTFALDPFFDNIINSPIDGVHSPVEFMGPENAEKLERAINRLYRLYMAQAINANMRQNISESDHELPDNVDNQRIFTGTSLILTPRIKMQRTSKLVLQILLGASVVCGALAWSLVPVRGILEHSPGSIAGTMSLLVGSRWVESLDGERKEEVSKGEKKDRLSSGTAQATRKYRLQWWENATLEGGRRFGIDFI